MPECMSSRLCAALVGKLFNRFPPSSHQTFELSHHMDALTPSITMAQWLVRPLAEHRQKGSETVGPAQVGYPCVWF